MPQSWPSQWILLFILFILSFIVILSMIFFIFVNQIDKNQLCSQSFFQLNWQW